MLNGLLMGGWIELTAGAAIIIMYAFWGYLDNWELPDAFTPPAQFLTYPVATWAAGLRPGNLRLQLTVQAGVRWAAAVTHIIDEDCQIYVGGPSNGEYK